jgi:hypothetical protein
MSKFNKSEWSSYPSISYSPASGDDYMLLTRTGNVTFDSNPNVGAGQKIVFLIDGDVTINSNMSVASGGYLAIIANGTITFSSNVTNAQGVFVADSISILSNNSGLHDDVLFTGQGSFIGYNSITMTRDRGVTNNTAPAETFSFRPDFVISSPLPMMTKDSTWREVVPR